jgi:hypothetical protein
VRHDELIKIDSGSDDYDLLVVCGMQAECFRQQRESGMDDSSCYLWRVLLHAWCAFLFLSRSVLVFTTCFESLLLSLNGLSSWIDRGQSRGSEVLVD